MLLQSQKVLTTNHKCFRLKLSSPYPCNSLCGSLVLPCTWHQIKVCCLQLKLGPLAPLYILLSINVLLETIMQHQEALSWWQRTSCHLGGTHSRVFGWKPPSFADVLSSEHFHPCFGHVRMIKSHPLTSVFCAEITLLFSDIWLKCNWRCYQNRVTEKMESTLLQNPSARINHAASVFYVLHIEMHTDRNKTAAAAPA